MRNSRIFLYIFTMLIFLTTCKENKVGPDPKDPQLPAQLTIVEPNKSETYWTDEAVSCLHDAPDYNAQTEWQANGAAVSCTDGQLVTELPAGTHTITATISEGGESVTATVDITVKAAFSVTLDNPQSGEEFFVGDEVNCAATITPKEYQDHPITITVGGNDCTSSPARLAEAGEVDVRASAEIDGRTEADEATVRALPVVAGKIYPLTDQGVSGQAGGFSITLTADGETLTTTSAANGDFRFPDAPLDIYERESITIEVAETGNFFGAKAVLSYYGPIDYNSENLEPPFVPPGQHLQEIIEDDELGFVLAPRVWQIRCGPFAGESTSVKLPEAFKRYDSGRQYSSFYMLFDVRHSTRMYRKLLPEDRPLKTAFNRADSEVPITAADSTVFWAETENVEAKICRGDLFTPATIDEVPTRDDGVQIMTTNSGAAGGARKNGDGHIIGGGILLPIADFGNSDTQAHELNQVLGFGETSEWDGIMASNGIFNNATKYSTDDIAHIQLYMDTVDLQSNEGVSFGVYAWRRVFSIPSLPDN